MRTRSLLLLALTVALMPAVVPGEEPDETKQAVKIRLHPMPAPRPALKYQLLPPFLDRRPGNAAVWWNRIPAEQTPFLTELYKDGGYWDKIEEWMKIPLGDPREKEFRAQRPEIAGAANALYRQIAEAARFESCDWQLPVRRGNIMAMLLPDIQSTRTYGRLLAAKARLEAAEGRYGESVEAIQAGFALARDAAQGQVLVSALVGTALGTMMTNRIEEIIQQPDTPNLYWALSALPRPLIDFRPAFESEGNFLFLQFPELRDLEKKDLAPEQWSKVLHKTVSEFFGFSRVEALGVPPPVPVEAFTATFGLQGYPMARDYLIEHGRAAADVEAMPVAKVILLYSVEMYQELSDESFKLAALPYAEGKGLHRQAERRLEEVSAGRREIIPFAGALLPAGIAAKEAEVRMEWILARLRIIEALRIYAAAHGGQLPDRLEDIHEVPIPRNPLDDKPFDYRREGNRALLTVREGPRSLPWNYEITMLQGDRR